MGAEDEQPSHRKEDSARNHSRDVVQLVRARDAEKEAADGMSAKAPPAAARSRGGRAVGVVGENGNDGDGEIDGAAAQRMERALRQRVCHVLGVDMADEGEALVPSGGLSRGRIDWGQVRTLTDHLALGQDTAPGGADGEEPGMSGGTGGEEDAGQAAATAAIPDVPHLRTGIDAHAVEAEAEDGEKKDANNARDTTEHVVVASPEIASGALATTSAPPWSIGECPGRIGPARVEVDRAHMAGDMRLDESGTCVTSHSNFSSVRATACVFEGKWMFEATLGSSGIMQLGWATFRCPFTHEHGVGDAQDSYAYDGHRVRKWNVSCHPYGGSLPGLPGTSQRRDRTRPRPSSLR